MSAPARRSPLSALRVFARAWRTLRPLLGDSPWPVVVLAVASALAGLTEAALLGLIAQIALALADGAKTTTVALGPVAAGTSLGWLVAVAAALVVARFALHVVVAWLPARISADVQTRLRVRLLDAYARASLPAQLDEADGSLLELSSSHVLRAGQAVITAATGLSAAVVLAAMLATAVAASPIAVGLVAVLGVVLYGVLRPVGALARRLNRDLASSNVDLATELAEAGRLTEEAHVFGVTPAVAGRLRAAAEAIRGLLFRTELVNRMAIAVYQSTALLLVVGGLGLLVAVRPADLAGVGVVVLVLVRSLSYGQALQHTYTALNATLPFIDAAEAAVARLEARALADGNTPLDRPTELALENVSFAYRDRPVLTGVTASVRRGEVVGIIGPSGAGKSTLVQVLLRLREPTAGRYLVDGIPAGRIRRADWARGVAAVPQEPRLMRGTIADNIRFLRDLPDEVIVDAACRAHVHDDIVARGGYDTLIDHRSDTLSGGQRQRIALARALAGDPAVLILDEPTSALDARSEALILQSLAELRGRVTIFVVAHRPALLEICDQIWEAGEGTVRVRAATAPGVAP